jgi:hypothetical protein
LVRGVDGLAFRCCAEGHRGSDRKDHGSQDAGGDPDDRPQSQQDGMLTIEHSGDDPGFAWPQPWSLINEGHCITKDKMARVIPGPQFDEIVRRVNLRFCVCRFAKGLERICIREDP